MTDLEIHAEVQPMSRLTRRASISELRIDVNGIERSLWLKKEWLNEYGSIKARTAHGLLAAAERKGQLARGGAVVESSSGNLGVALAGLCHLRGYRAIIVVDSYTPAQSIADMRAFGAEIVEVAAAGRESSVVERVKTVKRLLETRPGVHWTNQYENPANPAIHEELTAPELYRSLGSDRLDAVVASVSTGGTLAGISRYFRRQNPRTRVVAVDAVGSSATEGTTAVRPNKIAGFGSSLRSKFLESDSWDDMVSIPDAMTTVACRTLLLRSGIMLGGSSGATVLGAVVAAGRDPNLRHLACVCPDSGEKYAHAIYGGRALVREPVNDEVAAALARLATCTKGDEL